MNSENPIDYKYPIYGTNLFVNFKAKLKEKYEEVTSNNMYKGVPVILKKYDRFTPILSDASYVSFTDILGYYNPDTEIFTIDICTPTGKALRDVMKFANIVLYPIVVGKTEMIDCKIRSVDYKIIALGLCNKCRVEVN